jgi:hypothetical protein
MRTQNRIKNRIEIALAQLPAVIAAHHATGHSTCETILLLRTRLHFGERHATLIERFGMLGNLDRRNARYVNILRRFDSLNCLTPSRVQAQFQMPRVDAPGHRPLYPLGNSCPGAIAFALKRAKKA